MAMKVEKLRSGEWRIIGKDGVVSHLSTEQFLSIFGIEPYEGHFEVNVDVEENTGFDPNYFVGLTRDWSGWYDPD